MINKPIFTQSIDLGDGRQITLETGKLAKQADGSVVLRIGNLMMLATVVANKEAKEGADFLPLTVDYQEKYAAAGKFPGGFHKREARISNYEILISRMIDRTLRPLFPDDYHCEIQVAVTLMSSDDNILPDNLTGLAASAAICISDIPFNGPISEVRVAKIDGKFVINPEISALVDAQMDIIVCGSEKDINMVEGSMHEQSEADMIEALKIAHDAIKIQCRAQKEFMALCGKAKRDYKKQEEKPEIKEKVISELTDKIYEIASKNTVKQERHDLFDTIWNTYKESLSDEEKADLFFHKMYYEELMMKIVREFILDKNKRLDGRKCDEIREIECEVDYLPSTHGSALFTRGETQSITTVTLGSRLDEQLIDGAVLRGYDKFILHYNFPSFSTGEVKPNRGPGRREIGHGNLAKRALEMVMPSLEENPYTIRVVSDILESNGSSSMATVCAGCLALMDAGIKLRKPVSGIAMGLIHDAETGKYAVLSDILGDEDHLGDMDFKITGTEDGITACQMDIKVDGLSFEILAEALEQAKRGRIHILNIMKQTMPEARPDYKPHAPRIEKFHVLNEFIGAIIGTGGKVIQQIQKETGTVISITEEPDGRGLVEIASKNVESLEKAVKWINGLTEKPEVGKIYQGVVKTLVDFGAFVEFLPGKDGLLHNSEYSWEKYVQVSDILKTGDPIEVKLIALDFRTGKAKLSRRVLLERDPNLPPDERDSPDYGADRRSSGGRDSRGGGRDSRGSGRDSRDRDRGPRR